MNKAEVRGMTQKVAAYIDKAIEGLIEKLSMELSSKVDGYDGSFCADETTKEVLDLHDKYVKALTTMLMADCKPDDAVNEDLDTPTELSADAIRVRDLFRKYITTIQPEDQKPFLCQLRDEYLNNPEFGAGFMAAISDAADKSLDAIKHANCNEQLEDDYDTDYRYYVYDASENVVSDGFEFEEDAVDFAEKNEYPIVKVHNYFIDESGKLRPDGEPEVIWNA